MTRVMKAHSFKFLGGKKLPHYSGGSNPEDFLREMEAQLKMRSKEEGCSAITCLGP